MAKIRVGRSFGAEYENIYRFQTPTQGLASSACYVGAQIVMILTGRYLADSPEGQTDRMVRAGAGDVIYWPAGMDHIERSGKDEPLKNIGLHFRWLSASPTLTRMVHDRFGNIRSLCEAMLAVTESGLPQRKIMLNAYLSAIIAEYIRLAAKQGEGLQAKVLYYIQEHMGSPISLHNLAEHVRLDRRHFCRKYKALTGRSPIEDVRRIKAEHAANSLRCRNTGLKTVALGVGLNDPLLLSKWISKYVGIPVRDLRK